MRQLTPQEITHIFDGLCKVLDLKAALLLPGPERSREFNRCCIAYEQSMKDEALGEALSLGKYGAVILNRKDIYGYLRCRSPSSSLNDTSFPPVNMKQAYAFVIIHELTHIQEFIESGRIKQERVDYKAIESLFIKRVKAIDKWFGGVQAANTLAEDLGIRDRQHENPFYDKCFINMLKTRKYYRKL